MNNKGFMMAEVVVVSSIILVFLTALYVSYNKIYSVYSTRIRYYDVNTLYRLGYYRDELVNSGKMSDWINKGNLDDICNNPKDGDRICNVIVDHAEDTVLLTSKQRFSSIESSITNLKPTFKDYISFLSSSIDSVQDDYIMLIERCDVNTPDKCYYSYLGIPVECTGWEA